MRISKFISVGENIHCTRVYKTDGQFVRKDGPQPAILYKSGGKAKELPVPESFLQGADWAQGRVKHCAAAVWQGLHGTPENRAAGVDYVESQARRQEAAGASYLDINVDEFTTDTEERIKAMLWAVGVAQKVTRIPMSIDSSNTDILDAGLKACDPARGRPMVNSVSLERASAVEVARKHRAVVIASAAGEKDLPTTVEEKLANLDRLMPRLAAEGFEPEAIHVDPLVFPISVDGLNGRRFIDSVAAIRAKYGPKIHIVAGLSNVSFGMPNRKLINQTFTHLAVEAGADGGIVDPFQLNLEVLNALDIDSEGYKLARALLLGEDEYGMEFISASRDGRI